MDKYSALVGNSWGEPAGGPQAVEIDGVPATLDFSFVFNRSGPVRLELVQEIPGTIWTPGAGVHHLGFWSDDVDGESETLTREGYPVTVGIFIDPSAPPMVTYHQGFGGVYFELVSTSLRPVIEALWA
jgi:hypothetical protein